MSMGMFFSSFKQEHIKEMLDNKRLVDEYLHEYAIANTDLGDSHEVISALFDDTTQLLSIGKFCFPECESMATIITHEELKKVLENYDNLNLTDEKIIEQIASLDDENIYRLESLKEFPDEVVSELDGIIKFYRDAVENNYGIVSILG